MILKVTTKNCQITGSTSHYIDTYFNKLTRMLSHEAPDLVVLRITIIKNVDRYHPQRVSHQKGKTYSDTKTALANYEGSMTCRLNKNRLYARFKGQTTEECMDLGFSRIFSLIKKHKETHFSSESRYPDHSSIRGL